MTEYEVAGVLDVGVAEVAAFGDETIVVEHDDPGERLVCRPKDES